MPAKKKSTAATTRSTSKPVSKQQPMLASRVKARIVAWVRTEQSLTPHRSFRMTHKHDKPRAATVPTTWSLIKQTFGLIKLSPGAFIGLGLLYLVFALLVLGTDTQDQYVSIKDAISQNGGTAIDKTVSLFVLILRGALAPDLSAGQQVVQWIAQFLLVLSVIWMGRHVLGGKKPTIPEALFNAPTPFISSIVVLAVMVLELLPVGAAVYVFNIAATKGFLDYAGFGLLVGALCFLCLLLSLYLVVTAIIGLVIVTLPGMYPFAAIRSAKKLILGRRGNVGLRLLGGGAWLLMLWVVTLVPFLLADVSSSRLEAIPFVPTAVLLLSGFSLVLAPLYLYRLYRSLL